MVPDIDPATVIGEYPFSASFLLTSFARAQKRTAHETLDNSDPCKLVEIQTMFIQLNKNIIYDEKFLIRNGLDGYLRVPMTPENIIVPEELLSALFAVMHGFSGVGKTNQKPIKAMIDVLKKHDELLSTKIEKKEIIERAMSCFKRSIIAKTPVFVKSETSAKQNSESHRQVKFVKPPIYLGITVESDPEYLRKLSKTFENAFNQAGEPKSLIEDFKQMIREQKPFSPWSFPASYHITTMFIGGNKNKLKLPQCEYFEEAIKVTIDIRAVIYVPGKLVAGICFPKGVEIENEYPHMTLMVSDGWKPMMSNSVIQATCGKGMAFHEAYKAAS